MTLTTETKWMPISTAPNDDTPHYRGLWVYSAGVPIYFQSVLGYFDEGDWYEMDGEFCGWHWSDFTHWHPCPEIPKPE